MVAGLINSVVPTIVTTPTMLHIVGELATYLLVVVDRSFVTDKTKQGFKITDSPYIVSCPAFESKEAALSLSHS
jgi:hypothetical protein